MSTCKSSMTTGTPAVKTVDWTRVPDEELATDIDDSDSREAEAEQKREAEEAKRAAAAEARKQQQTDSEAQASGSWANASVCIRCTRLRLSCVIPAGIKSRLACRLCMKAKEWCEWPEVEMTASRAGTSPQGGECKKQAKKVADEDDDDEVVILSGQKTKQKGGSKSLEEITDQQWGELVQVVSTRMDVANGHLERIASQQQVLLLKLVEVAGATGLGRAKEVVRRSEEPQELQGEELGAQEGETEGVPGGALEGEPEYVLGEEPENGAGVEDGTGEEAQKKDKGKGKGKAT
ncbi:hypothetical protein ID866_11872 [Astraeus odoratus]|nr:hypothetical protein ID866_11872 [Astraeus odoratus]